MHEQSETVERDGRYVNVYGTGRKKGKVLPPQGRVPFGERASYGSIPDAVGMAQLRSALHGFETPHKEDEDERIRQLIGGMGVAR